MAKRRMSVQMFVAHSKRVLKLAARFGWLPAARYTNLRDVRGFERLGFLDIDWRNYSFARHLQAAAATTPMITVACDITDRRQIPRILDEARELSRFAERVLIVPKSRSLAPDLEELIPNEFHFGYSVPTEYGGTPIRPQAFRRPVHLLGGRPDVQRSLAEQMNVVSMDCNRFTYDARFGKYFDGHVFRYHPHGGYDRCIQDSLDNISALWSDYVPKRRPAGRRRGG